MTVRINVAENEVYVLSSLVEAPRDELGAPPPGVEAYTLPSTGYRRSARVLGSLGDLFEVLPDLIEYSPTRWEQHQAGYQTQPAVPLGMAFEILRQDEGYTVLCWPGGEPEFTVAPVEGGWLVSGMSLSPFYDGAALQAFGSVGDVVDFLRSELG